MRNPNSLLYLKKGGWNKGLKMSESFKEKLKGARLNIRGENSHNWTGGKPKCSNCGKQLNRYASTRCKLCFHLSTRGENHWAWKGGVYPRNMTRIEYKEWRMAVFTKDNFTCQFCGDKGIYLNADHIKRWADYPELRFEVSNGQTLCEGCHLSKTIYESKLSELEKPVCGQEGMVSK